MYNWIYALIPFALFCFLSVLLTRNRFPAKCTHIVWAAVIAAVSVTHIVLFSLDQADMLLLSLMPVTAYLPVTIAFFVLSKRNFVSNTLAALLAVLCAVSLILAHSMVSNIWAGQMESAANRGPVLTALHFVVLLVGGAALGFIGFRFLRKVFQREKVIGDQTWYVLPAVFLLLLFSLYQKEKVTQPLMIAFLLVMDVSVLAVITAFVVSKFKNADMEAQRAAVEQQLAAERARYGALKTSLESDKRYRHDIRHHFSAIAALASAGNNSTVTEYVNTLGAKLTETEVRRYCKNAVLNAVLSAFGQRAEEAGIHTEIEAAVPERPPADEYDLCALIGNALENALNACAKIADGAKKKIAVTVRCDDVKTIVEVTNTVARNVPLDKDGLPVYERSEEHGWGLSSIGCIVKNYGGILKCSSEHETFTLAAVLFGKQEAPPARKRSKKQTTLYSFAAVPLILLTAILSVNCMPATIDALKSVPVVGKVVEIVDFRTWGWEWGDSKIDIKEPITNDPDLNEMISGYVKECREKFEWYYARKYHGYVYTEFTSKEIVNDEDMYVLRMSCLIQAGSSAEYLRYFVVDKASGEIVALSDLFQEGSDWNDVLSGEIRRQMQAIVDADEGDFFGFGLFTDTPGFTRLDDPNFYIDAYRRLVVVFDEQEVAPGNMGSPKFVIPYETVKDILLENSLLKEGA